MLSTAEADAVEALTTSAIISITAALGLFAVPEAVSSIERAMTPGRRPLSGFGSRLTEKHGRVVALDLPSDLFRAAPQEQERWQTEVATLIASGLLGSSYELLKSRHASKDPLWQFFRHARNAAFHGNEFYFIRNEPKYPAVWRGLAITKSLEGNPLFFDFIQFADVFILLSDIMAMIGIPPGEAPMFRFEEIDSTWTF